MNRPEGKIISFNRVALLVLVLMIFSAFIVPKPARSQPTVSDSSLREVHLRMCSSELSPITPSEDESPQRKSVPNGFEHGRLKSFGKTVYKKVGEWKLDNTASVIKIQPPLKFVIWLSSTSVSSGEFKFTLKYGATVVAGPTETDVSSIDGEAKRFEIPSHANITTTKGGEPITLVIDARVNGNGMAVEYGDFQMDSGVAFMCDAIKYVSLKADCNGVYAEFIDSFRASLNNLYPKLRIDGELVEDNKEGDTYLERGISDQANYLFTWDIRPKKGEHMFEVGIAYAEKDINTSWNIQRAIMIKSPSEPGLFADMELGNLIALVILGLFLLIYFVVALSIVRRRASARSIYVQRSPVPIRYKMIVSKRMASYGKKKGVPKPPPGKGTKRMSFHTKKK